MRNFNHRSLSVLANQVNDALASLAAVTRSMVNLIPIPGFRHAHPLQHEQDRTHTQKRMREVATIGVWVAYAGLKPVWRLGLLPAVAIARCARSRVEHRDSCSSSAAV